MATLLTATTDNGKNETDGAEDDKQGATSDTKVSCSTEAHDAQADVKDWQEEALLEEGKPVNVDEEKHNLHDRKGEEDDSHDKGKEEDVGRRILCFSFLIVGSIVSWVAASPDAQTLHVICPVSHDAVSSASNDSRDRAKDDQNDVDSVWNRHHEK